MQSAARILMIGMESRLKKQVLQIVEEYNCGSSNCMELDTAGEFLDYLDMHWDPFSVVLAGSALDGISHQEIAQATRAKFEGTRFYYCSEKRSEGFERANYIKNGFNDAFILPFDFDLMKRNLSESLAIGNKAVYRSIKLVDLDPGSILNFDLHVMLPQNRKYIRYVNGGDELDENKWSKLRDRKVGSIYIEQGEMQKFYDYSSQRLAELASTKGGVSETERRSKLESSIRSLIAGIFETKTGGFENGREMLEDASKIVSGCLKQTEQGNYYSKILETVEDAADSSSHLSCVGTLAPLFSMISGIGKPEEIAIAALFHDLGLTEVPAEIVGKNPEQRTQEERDLFEKHPAYTLNMLREKKVSLSETIQTMILQHHERRDGRGFPLHIGEPRLLIESQVLGLADEFEYRTRYRSDGTFLKPLVALEQISKERLFNPNLIEKIMMVFREQKGETDT